MCYVIVPFVIPTTHEKTIEIYGPNYGKVLGTCTPVASVIVDWLLPVYT